MPNSSTFGRRSGGTVTVIEEPVRRSTMRNAKITFWVLWVVITLLSSTVLASRWHPVLALLAGLLIGAVAAATAGLLVLAWPVIRTIWWWIPEIAALTGLMAGWVWLADRLAFALLLGAVTLIAGVPAAIPQVRRRITALSWCLATRHRIRTCFAEFLVYNRTGSLPLILWCIPTPVGERVWIFLRPGLTLDAVQSRADQIAVTCWATSAVAMAASARNSAFIRIDVKRRDALTGTVVSPLLSHVIPGAPAKGQDTASAPTALDLPDVSAAEVIPGKTVPWRTDKKAPAVVPAVPDSSGDDLSDWL
jgi:hypothetical protein